MALCGCLAAARATAGRNTALVIDSTTAGVLAEIAAATAAPCIRLDASRATEPAGPQATKLGGAFYSPPGFLWPLDARSRPLWPLAQLNFAGLPGLDGFPRAGILQFFIAGDDLYGMDLDHPTRQTGFRVVYHPQVGESTVPNPPQVEVEDESMLPFTGEFSLAARPDTMSMTPSDWRFDIAFSEASSRQPGRAGSPGPLEFNDDVHNAMIESDEKGIFGHRIGGYPTFTQTDPRLWDPSLQGHTALLLQIDSSLDDRSGEILWGDMGVACFLIEPERLSRCDFSHVLYTWDCS
jgi:uncharacterized protein YwqG